MILANGLFSGMALNIWASNDWLVLSVNNHSGSLSVGLFKKYSINGWMPKAIAAIKQIIKQLRIKNMMDLFCLLTIRYKKSIAANGLRNIATARNSPPNGLSLYL